MKKQRLHVSAGKMFCLSRGEYSDYGYEGHFLALVEITPEMFHEVETEANGKKNDFDQYEYGADDRFIPALVRRGWVMDVDCIEIHTGSYGRLNLS